MADFFKNKNFDVNYKKRPHDEYKSLLEKLPEETKRKLDWQRNIILLIVLLCVIGLVVVLAATGVGVDKTITGSIFDGSSEISIACFGDSLTEGYVTDENGDSYICEETYPEVMKTEIAKTYDTALTVTNYGISGDVAANTSYKRVDSDADVAVVLYMANNFINGEEYEGILEANVSGLENQGSIVFLVNYPICEGSEYEEALEDANDYIEQVSESEGVTMLDAADYFETHINNGTYSQDELFCSDGLHLTETGYALLGTFVAEGLMNADIE